MMVEFIVAWVGCDRHDLVYERWVENSFQQYFVENVRSLRCHRDEEFRHQKKDRHEQERV